MEVIYDKKHNSCAVRFSKEDALIIYHREEDTEIHSCIGGKPQFLEEELLVELTEEELDREF